MSLVNDSPSTFAFVDLFCGAGGLSLGFQQAGFKCVQAIDNNGPAVATYKRNFEDHIQKLSISESTELGVADVIIGGPPCQGFSSAGLRRSDDARNSLVRVYAELIARHRPRAFVFENVEGFLTADEGNRILDLLTPLVTAGYRIHLRKINAANYGVPQHRKRVLGIGMLGSDPTFPEPVHRAYGAPGSTKTSNHLPPCPTIMEALEGLPAPQSVPPGGPQGHYTRPVSDIELERMQHLAPGQTMRDLPEELWHDSYRRRAYRRVMDGTPTERRGGAPAGLKRLKPDEPSKAITSGAVSEFVHPTENRYLTLRECARIQTFPDDFEFVGSSAECSVQIGNAVPPLLGLEVARSLMRDLRQQKIGAVALPGALLSFVPTVAEGTSPALAKVQDTIKARFFSTNQDDNQAEQLTLWP